MKLSTIVSGIERAFSVNGFGFHLCQGGGVYREEWKKRVLGEGEIYIVMVRGDRERERVSGRESGERERERKRAKEREKIYI